MPSQNKSSSEAPPVNHDIPVFKGWSFLGQGAHNYAYISEDGSRVLKIQKIKSDTDTPSRSVRLWNQINRNLVIDNIQLLPAKEEKVVSELGNVEYLGWTSPYIRGTAASDDEASTALLDVFNTSQRIVTDAATCSNFIKTPSGIVVCIDVGMALELEHFDYQYMQGVVSNLTDAKTSKMLPVKGVSKEPHLNVGKDKMSDNPGVMGFYSDLFSDKKTNVTLEKEPRKDTSGFSTELKLDPQERKLRRFSLVSQVTWANLLKTYDNFFNESHSLSPKIVATTKALLFIRTHRPDITNVEFLRNNYSLINQLAEAYTKERENPTQYKHTIEETKLQLFMARPVIDVAASCIVHLQNYINSRGSVDKNGTFISSWGTYFFRNEELTKQKVKIVRELIRRIQEVKSPEEISNLLTEKTKDNQFIKAVYTSGGVMACLGRCFSLVGMAKNIEPDLGKTKELK